MKPILVIIFLFMPLFSNAKLFKGTIGKYPIVISFPVEDIGKYSNNGGYFYESKRQGLVFTEATGTENHIALRVGYTNDDSAEKFDLVKNKDGSYSGTWANKSKKNLSVQVSPIEMKSVKNEYFSLQEIRDSPIEELWYMASSKLTFTIDTTVFVGKHKIEWYKDNIYGISFFRIASKNPNLNKILIDRHLEIINENFSGCNCDNDTFVPFEITETGVNIISYSFNKGICYCYSAAHPFWGEEINNFDLQRDKILDFDEVFHFSKKPVIYDEKNWGEWVTYRKQFVAPQIIEFLKITDKSLLPTPEDEVQQDDGECYFLENDYWWSLENWLLNKMSIQITHYEPARGYGPCMQRFEIPNKLLKTYLSGAYKNRVFQD